jgi:MSHA biogenesis protein MshN
VPAAVEEPEPLPSETERSAADISAPTDTELRTLAADPEAQPHFETLKLALSIDTPIPERQPRSSKPAPARRAPPRPAEPSAAVPDPLPVLAVNSAARVERRERSTTPVERTESQFASAMNLLNEGRIAEAQNLLGALIASNPSEERARQALVALLLEQKRLEEAMLVLRQGLALNPAQTQFAVVLARILAERRDYYGALEILTRARPTAKNAEFSSLLGAVLQRLARHREAVAAYRAALEESPTNAGALMGLAISLESLQERTEALEAYRRALASASLSAELSAYAEQKVKELR